MRTLSPVFIASNKILLLTIERPSLNILYPKCNTFYFRITIEWLERIVLIHISGEMGKVLSLMTRPIRTFNIENRAHKIISMEKPIPAPQHASVEKQKEAASKLNPSFMQQHLKKDTQLDERLKNVYVTSSDPEQGTDKFEDQRSSKNLPQSRESLPDFEYGVFEPEVAPKGKCTLKHAITFISKHKEDPVKHSIDNIALEYNLDKKIVENILTHFRIYQFIDNVPVDPSAAEEIHRASFMKKVKEFNLRRKQEKLGSKS